MLDRVSASALFFTFIIFVVTILWIWSKQAGLI